MNLRVLYVIFCITFESSCVSLANVYVPDHSDEMQALAFVYQV
jgi:hypothetical protein